MALYNTQQRKHVILILAIALGIFILWLGATVLPAFFGSIILYVLCRPIHVYLVQCKKCSASLSSLAIMLATLFIVVLPLYFIFITIIKKAKSYYEMFNSNADTIKQTVTFLNTKASKYVDVNNIITNLSETLQSKGAAFLGNTLSGTMQALFSIAIMYFMLYYMFAYYKKFEQAITDYLPFEKTDRDEIAKDLKNNTFSNIIGQTIISIVQGLLLGFGFWLFGLTDAWFWGVIAIFVSFLPVIGTPIIFIPAAIVMFAQGQSGAGWGILAYGFIIVTNIDYPLRLWLGKKMGDIHPVITIIGVIIGIPFFGIIGLVYGPMLISCFLIITKIFKKYNTASNTINE